MRKFLLGFVFLFLIKTVCADIVLTEVMYNPIQGSDTDLEWIEIYNNGTNSEDLSLWKIDGNTFDDFTISPGEFVVIARELIDGTDLDNESFENIYGNGDGAWNSDDENFRAFDGDFSLTELDTINITDGTYFEILNYNSSLGGNGNGFSIEKIKENKENSLDNWRESTVLYGTPGFGNAIKEGTNIVDVNVDVTGTGPILSLINITDDSSDNGIQIRPKTSTNKTITINLLVNSSFGIGNVSKVSGNLNGNYVELTKAFDVDSYSGIFNGATVMEYFRLPGNYTLNISAIDTFNETGSSLIDFEYLSLLAISVSKNSISFGKVEPGKISDTQSIIVLNGGNVDLDLEVYGGNLESGSNKINASNFEYSNGLLWKSLDYRPRMLDFNLTIGNTGKDLGFRLNVPVSTRPSVYAGYVNLVGIQK